MAYKTLRLSDQVSLIQETGVANFMRCNIWYVRGKNCDLVIDTGMGLSSLRDWIMVHQADLTDLPRNQRSASGSRQKSHPLKAIVTHSHFDHSGCLHEFDIRLGHPAEADILQAPTASNVLFEGAWTKIGIVDTARHPQFSPQTYHITPAPLTGYLDEGDVLDLGDRVYQILHLPGHSPGSIGLWDKTCLLYTSPSPRDS